MANELLRFFFPLKIFTYLEYEHSDSIRNNPLEEITPAEALAYEDEILAAIARENRSFDNDRGLAEYICTESLNEKVYSLYPTVEIWNGELWGVMTAGITEALSEEETTELLDFIERQNGDGYGAELEQSSIKTSAGEIYVSFWNSESYSIKLEQELKSSAPDLGYSGPVMRGM